MLTSRDPNLGKVVLYQLSYCRISRFIADAKLIKFSEVRKFLGQ